MVDDEFVANLPADPLLALKCIVDESSGKIKNVEPGKETEIFEKRLIHFLALSIAIIKKHSVVIGFSPPEMTAERASNIAAIRDYFQKLEKATDKLGAQNLLHTSLSVYERELNVGFHYEFSDGEIERLQSLITELRNALTGAAYLDEDHKRRLLERLEKLQGELHKRVSDLDVFLGVTVQIGAVAKRFGEDAKPLVDRVREIGEIVAGVFRRAEKLPPGPEFPLLSKSDDADE